MATDFFKNGVAYLRRQLLENASDSVTVERNGTEIGTFQAVVAKSEFEDADREGRRVNVYVVDFLIPGESNYRAQKGDVIIYDSQQYVVRPLGKEVWRWDDPYKELMRVHAMLFSTN